MDEILASAQLGNGRSVHIATLARQTIIDSGAEHLGVCAYFLFEANDLPGEKGISVLGKVLRHAFLKTRSFPESGDARQVARGSAYRRSWADPRKMRGIDTTRLSTVYSFLRLLTERQDIDNRSSRSSLVQHFSQCVGRIRID